mgnify:FL=1
MKIVGLNQVGLRRRGFKPDTMHTLEKAFKILFFSGLNTSQAVERIKTEVPSIDEIKLILDFIKNSSRGLIK